MPLNRLHWYVRWPCKWAAFALVYFIVCFPYPSLFIRHVRHWSNPNALIEPDAPALQPWVQELRAMPAESDPRAVLKRVQQFVYNHVPYDWDWNTWGLVDYMPTVTEVIEMGREDCDGRAVIAASLLRNLGYNARLVTDFAHVWVATDYGETMGPGKIKTVEVTDKGLKFQWGGLIQLPRTIAYGVAVFPPERELILVAAAWVLFLVRRGGHDYLKPLLWAELAGLAALIVAFVLMFFRMWNRTPAIAAAENADGGGR
jgi:hypothetical protein